MDRVDFGGTDDLTALTTENVTVMSSTVTRSPPTDDSSAAPRPEVAPSRNATENATNVAGASTSAVSSEMTAEPTGVSVLTTAQAELTTVQAELTTAASTDLNQTSDDAATAAGVSPTDEPKKTFQLTFDGDCNDYEGSAATNFTMSLRRTLAAKLQVELAEIIIGDITCGSVRVPVTIPSSSAEALTKLVGSGDLSVNGMTATGVAELPSAPATTTTLAAAPIGAQTTLATAPTDAQATVQAVLTTAQAKLTTVQAELTTVPAELTTVQAELTTVPAELTTVPAELTTVPAELTTVQAELTTVQAGLTTVPAEMTTVQAELTMVPAELTTATTTDLNQTSDDAATAAGVSPTDEPKKTFQLTFDGDCNDYEGSAATNFTMLLRRTLAAKLQVELAEIIIGDITCGSVRVPVTIPSSSAEALTKLVGSGDLSVNGMTATGVAELPSAPATTTTLAAAPIGAQTMVQAKLTTAQVKLTTVPAELMTLPTELTTVQAELTTVPAELTTVQAELTTVPAELTTVPAELTTVQAEPTTVPAELTTVPAELTTVQAELTTLPAELTTVPAELTTVQAELTTVATTDLNQTSDDAVTAAGVSPTDEPKKIFQLTFDGDCNDYEGSAATNFTMLLRRTLAAKLQVELAEIIIGDITCGSVRVPVTIPSSSADVLTKLVGSGDLSVNGMTATGVAELPSAPATTTTLAAAPIGAQTTLATTPTGAQTTVQAMLTTAQAKLTTVQAEQTTVPTELTTVQAELTTVQAELTTVATTDLNQTSDDAATTAGISPTDEPRKTFQLTFDGDCSKYVGNNGGFAMLLRRTLASKLDLPRSEVVIGNITCGSVRVAVTIPSSSAEALAKLVESGDFKIDGMTATGVVEQPSGPVETTTVPTTPIGAQTTVATTPTGATSSSVVLTSEVKTTMTTEVPTMTSEVPTTMATSEMSMMTTKATTMTPEVTTMTAEMQTTPSNMSTMTPEVSTMTSEAATMTSAALPTTAPGVASTSPDEASTSAGEVSTSSPLSPPTTEAPDSLTSNERLIVIVVCVVGGLIVLLAVLYACCHCSHKLRTASYSLEAPGPKADYVQLEKLGRAAPTYKDEAARSAGAAGAAATAPNGNTRPGQEPDARRDSNDLNLAAAAVAPPSGGYTNPSYESRPDDSPVSQASTAEYQPGVQPYPGGAGARGDPQASGGKVSGGFSPF